MLITNARLYTPHGTITRGWLRADNGTITNLGGSRPPEPAADEAVIDAGGMNLLPGFIDIHIHGSAGHDVMDSTPQALHEMARFLVRQGVTGFLPTTLTDGHESLMNALRNIKGAMESPGLGAVILGAHLEGPYLNLKKSGAQNPEHIREATQHEVDDLLSLGVLRLVDLAPEFEANHDLLRRCVAQGIAVSVAHSDATFEQVEAAAALGLSHSTHTFNAQSSLHHRGPGVVGAVMGNPAITCELIADGIHVHPGAMRALWAAKRLDKLVLVSDAMRAAGLPDGEYTLHDRAVVLRDGAVRLPDGTLAGSALTLDRALRTFMDATGEPLEALWPVVSLNAAHAVNLGHRKGSLQPGKDADLTLLDASLSVQMTIVGGSVAYDTGTAWQSG